MIDIVTIGDVHGRSVWKDIADIRILLSNKNIKPKYDYYIFEGDYSDSYDISNEEIKENLLDIIEFKKSYPEHVILLWGNHDVEYFLNVPWVSMNNKTITGFRAEYHFDMYTIFNENKDLFQIAFQIDNYIWVHAGIHIGWYNYVFKKEIKNANMDDMTISEQLNEAFRYKLECILDCDWYRGGTKRVGGPLWCSKILIDKKPIKGYHQIVGHTHLDDIYVRKISKNTSITYCDTLGNNNNGYFLTINKQI